MVDTNKTPPRVESPTARSPVEDWAWLPEASSPRRMRTPSLTSSPSLSPSPPGTPSATDQQHSSDPDQLYKWDGFLVTDGQLGRQVQPDQGMEGRWSEFPDVWFPASKGLHNRGNDCYRSAVLQALLHLPAFYRYMGVIHRNCTTYSSECLLCCIQDICHVYWSYEGISVDDEWAMIPSDMKAVDQSLYDEFHQALEVNLPADFEDLKNDILLNAQSDAREFLGYLIREQIQSKKSDADGISFDDMFELETQQAWTCADCGRTKSDKSKTMQLGLYVPLNQEGSEDGSTLKSYLESNFASTFRIRCDSASCRANAASTEQHSDGPERQVVTTITQAPEVLFIQFGRFDNLANKIFTEIRYPEFLDLNAHREPGLVDEECIYRLDSVVAHKGSDIDGGHYVAAVRTIAEGFVVVDDDEIASDRGGGFQEALRPTSRDWDGEAFILMYTKL
ncbi:hypothetical protein CBER1_04449 [Cercospora berteroae]|uniref:ubiquitinyl hydrolase 1 n=1 Tax=Cercospora berteroae TaxID=357750 RepID=A0A2S6CGL6_9PEZI|nr:hypothetical protein CBER1_04449 [Cercospora berteroae]